MSTHTNFHIHSNLDSSPLRVQGGVQTSGKTASIHITKGLSTLSMFFDSIQDIERVGTELITLAMQIREEGWKPNA